MMTTVSVTLPEKFQFLFLPGYRYRAAWGGRTAAKSMSFGRALVAMAHTEKLLILCCREYMNSMADSVMRVISSSIYDLGLQDHFDIQRTTVVHKYNGSEFIFKGLHNNINEIKSLHGVNICWIEEAQSLTQESWIILDPTIRPLKSGEKCEIWLSFNPEKSDAMVSKNFITNVIPNAISVKVGWQDNPWFASEMDQLRRIMQEHDPDNYAWVWEGEFKEQTEANVFRGKVFVQSFPDASDKTRFYHGLDFGFANDPTVLLRCWIKPSDEGFGEDLMIDREAYGHHIELDEMGDFFDANIETARFWPIVADSENPAQISYLCRQGYSVSPADKWKGCAEDGVQHLRAFRKIYIHERLCPNTAREFKTYKYKVDKQALDKDGKPTVLPILEEKNDHSPDACRYALNGMIQHRGGLGMWKRLMGGR